MGYNHFTFPFVKQLIIVAVNEPFFLLFTRLMLEGLPLGGRSLTLLDFFFAQRHVPLIRALR